MRGTETIALCGKGGVGKTSICSLMVKHLAEAKGRKILAIDADPASRLAASLGVGVKKSVDDIRKDLIGKIKKGEETDLTEMLHMLDYELFDALSESEGFALLSIGRPEDEGCFCRVNSLLKDIIHDLAGGFDCVLIDGEAGIEQINRRVMKSVDHLIIVSDTSAKGVSVARTIAAVARENQAVGCRTMGLVLNRVRSEDEVRSIASNIDIEIYGYIPEDEVIRQYDFQGRPLLTVPDGSAAGRLSADIAKRFMK